MSKFSFKIALPIILAGIFAVSVFMALSYDQLTTGFYLVTILFAIYLFFFGFAIGQNFTKPVKQILDGATNLSEGNLSSRVYLETKDELAELAKVFNKIAEELEQSRNQEEQLEKSVDMKVRARTQGLEETVNALEQKVRNRTAELEKMIKEAEIKK